MNSHMTTAILVVVLITAGAAYLSQKEVEEPEKILATCRAFSALELKQNGLVGEWEICTTIRMIK